MWTAGVADWLRFPRFPGQLGKQEILAFVHIPIGTPTNHGSDIDEVNVKLVEPAAPTVIGDMETGRVTP